MVGSQGIYPRLDFPLGTRIMHSDPRVVHPSPLPCMYSFRIHLQQSDTNFIRFR